MPFWKSLGFGGGEKASGFWMHLIKYLFGILIFHFIYITITRSHAGKYKAIQHTLRFETNYHGGGGGSRLFTYD